MEVVAVPADITSHLNDLNVRLQGKNRPHVSCLCFPEEAGGVQMWLKSKLASLFKTFGSDSRKTSPSQLCWIPGKTDLKCPNSIWRFPSGKTNLVHRKSISRQKYCRILNWSHEYLPMGKCCCFTNRANQAPRKPSTAGISRSPRYFLDKMVTAAGVPLLQKMAHQILTMFPSMYCWDSAFSTMSIVKNSFRSTLTNEQLHQCLRLALTTFIPKFKQLVTQRRCHLSH